MSPVFVGATLVTLKGRVKRAFGVWDDLNIRVCPQPLNQGDRDFSAWVRVAKRVQHFRENHLARDDADALCSQVRREFYGGLMKAVPDIREGLPIHGIGKRGFHVAGLSLQREVKSLFFFFRERRLRLQNAVQVEGGILDPLLLEGCCGF